MRKYSIENGEEELFPITSTNDYTFQLDFNEKARIRVYSKINNII